MASKASGERKFEVSKGTVGFPTEELFGEREWETPTSEIIADERRGMARGKSSREKEARAHQILVSNLLSLVEGKSFEDVDIWREI